MALALYWGSGSPYAWRVMLGLAFKGLPYEARLQSFSDGDLKRDAFLAMNPRGKVPVLVDGEVVVYESTACLAYLDRAYPDVPLFGHTPAEAALVWRLVCEADNYLRPITDRVVRPLYFGRHEAQRDDMIAALPEVHRELATLEARLAAAPWLAGDAPSAADCAVYPLIRGLVRAADKPAAAAFELGVSPMSERWPSVARWMARVERTPGFGATWPPHWGDAPVHAG